jgi:hypothetical protein
MTVTKRIRKKYRKGKVLLPPSALKTIIECNSSITNGNNNKKKQRTFIDNRLNGCIEKRIKLIAITTPDLIGNANKQGLKRTDSTPDMIVKEVHHALPNNIPTNTTSRYTSLQNPRTLENIAAARTMPPSKKIPYGGIVGAFDRQRKKNIIELVRFKKEFGHPNVPRTYKTNQKLATWVSNQRKNYREKNIIKEKLAALEGINFQWGPLQAGWNVKFVELVKFEQEFGHCNVSKEYEPNPKLGGWVRQQRRLGRGFHENKKTSLSESRMITLY